MFHVPPPLLLILEKSFSYVPLWCFIFLQLLLWPFFFVFSFQKFNYDLAQYRFLSAYPVWALIIFLSLDIYVFCQILGEGSSNVLSNTFPFHALSFLNVGLYWQSCPLLFVVLFCFLFSWIGGWAACHPLARQPLHTKLLLQLHFCSWSLRLFPCPMRLWHQPLGLGDRVTLTQPPLPASLVQYENPDTKQWSNRSIPANQRVVG